MRMLIAVKLYIFAFVALYAATSIAPDMTWPVTDMEWLATRLFIVGAVAKIAATYCAFSSLNTHRA